jgi:hypothetical protein
MTQVHTTQIRESQTGSLPGVKLLPFMTDYNNIVSVESGSKEPDGIELVSEKD